jgi:hypothetical protein
LQIQFSENVGSSISAADLVLLNQTTGQTIATGNIAVSYNSVNNTANFTFPGFAGWVLPVGNYQPSILATSVTDAAGNPLSANFSTTIAQVVGDWNFDGQRNAADISAMLNALCDLHNYQLTNNLSDTQLLLVGDVNGANGVTNADIQALLDLLAGSGASAGSSVSVAASAGMGALTDAINRATYRSNQIVTTSVIADDSLSANSTVTKPPLSLVATLLVDFPGDAEPLGRRNSTLLSVRSCPTGGSLEVLNAPMQSSTQARDNVFASIEDLRENSIYDARSNIDLSESSDVLRGEYLFVVFEKWSWAH